MKNRVIVWLRRDLRLADNPALSAALSGDFDAIVPVFIEAPEELGDWAPGGAQRVWQHFSLAALDEALQRLGSRLVLRTGPTIDALEALIAESGATAVYWNRLYDPRTIERDKRVKAHLDDQGIETASFAAHLLYEPWTVSTRQNAPYKVFTPFWKAVRDRPVATPLAAPSELPAVWDRIGSESLDALGLLPEIRWDDGIREAWTPGEAGAQDRLDHFVDDVLGRYATDRERPAVLGTVSVAASALGRDRAAPDRASRRGMAGRTRPRRGSRGREYVSERDRLARVRPPRALSLPGDARATAGYAVRVVSLVG